MINDDDDMESSKFSFFILHFISLGLDIAEFEQKLKHEKSIIGTADDDSDEDEKPSSITSVKKSILSPINVIYQNSHSLPTTTSIYKNF